MFGGNLRNRGSSPVLKIIQLGEHTVLIFFSTYLKFYKNCNIFSFFSLLDAPAVAGFSIY